MRPSSSLPDDTRSAGIQVPDDSLTETAKETLLSSLLVIIQHLNQTGVITIQRMCLTCHYYDSTNGHFCRLLEKTIADIELRIDCPEYLSSSGGA